MAQVEKIVLFYDKPFWPDNIECLILLWDIDDLASDINDWVKNMSLFNVLVGKEANGYMLEVRYIKVGKSW